jgi:hypothetical protein
MEMSSVFIWEQVNPWIYEITDGRAYVSRVECREHEKNSAFIEVEEKIARKQAKKAEKKLVKFANWNEFVPPRDILKKYVK